MHPTRPGKVLPQPKKDIMDFKDFIEEFTTPHQKKWLGEKEQMGSPHQLTKVSNNPARCTFHQLLVLAETLQLSPYRLMQEYDLGKDGMSDREKQIIKQFLENWTPKKKTNGTAVPQTLNGV